MDILALIDRVTARREDAIAVEDLGGALTYRELAARSDALAGQLVAAGIGREAIVGIAVRPSRAMAIAMLGVWKAGGAFAMLDLGSPRERLAMMVADCKPAVVIVDAVDRGSPALGAIAQLEVPDHGAHFDRAPIDLRQLAYVVFTSGSTGRPKGVAVTHAGLVNLVECQIDAFAIRETSRVLQFASITFDAVISEVLTALGAGATLCCEPRARDTELGELLERRKISVVTLPPSLLRVLPPNHLATIVSAGEACTPEIVARWASARRMVNAYGPSECTVCATQKIISGSTDTPTIGRTIANVDAYVLDDALGEAVTGELYLASRSLARGYLGRASLTAERFVPDPRGNGTRMYRTGDVVRRTGDELEFLGRSDDQIKLRGFRVEPREIEVTLRELPQVADVVVLPRTRASGDLALVAYVIGAATERALRDFAAARLPSYLRPAEYVSLTAWPMSANGKVDRKALANLRSTAAAAPPRTENERLLAEICARLLDREIDLDRGFLDQGGDSIATARLAIAIGQQFGRAIAIGEVFEAPTLRALAARLETASTTTILRLREGSALPVWMPGPVHGNALCYMRFASLLGPDTRAYGLQTPGVDGEAEPIADFVALAAHHARTIREHQPTGPYRLAGWSMGGSLAFEIAVQLERAGERVLLALIGSTPPSADHLEAARATMQGYETWRMGYFYVRSLAFSLGRPVELDFDEFSKLPDDRVIERVVAALQTLGPLGGDITPALARRWLGVVRANLFGFQNQVPTGAFHGRTLVIDPSGSNPLARDNLVRARAVPPGSWTELLAGEVERRSVGGNHYTVLLDPWVVEVASIVDAWLR